MMRLEYNLLWHCFNTSNNRDQAKLLLAHLTGMGDVLFMGA